MDFDYEAIQNRINGLQGNQARILLLVLLAKGQLRHLHTGQLLKAFDIAEGYHPEFDMKSFL